MPITACDDLAGGVDSFDRMKLWVDDLTMVGTGEVAGLRGKSSRRRVR